MPYILYETAARSSQTMPPHSVLIEHNRLVTATIVEVTRIVRPQVEVQGFVQACVLRCVPTAVY
jgi:hypothetical protein